jgi:hypothetical protein
LLKNAGVKPAPLCIARQDTSKIASRRDSQNITDGRELKNYPFSATF